MAARHEILNLVRRVHVFYWRPRIPARFSSARQEVATSPVEYNHVRHEALLGVDP
jgi:hypothetical protein